MPDEIDTSAAPEPSAEAAGESPPRETLYERVRRQIRERRAAERSGSQERQARLSNMDDPTGAATKRLRDAGVL